MTKETLTEKIGDAMLNALDNALFNPVAQMKIIAVTGILLGSLIVSAEIYDKINYTRGSLPRYEDVNKDGIKDRIMHDYLINKVVEYGVSDNSE